MMYGAWCGIPIAHALSGGPDAMMVLSAIVTAGLVAWWCAREEARHRPGLVSLIARPSQLLAPQCAAAVCDETHVAGVIVAGVIPARASPPDVSSPLISVQPARRDPRPAGLSASGIRRLSIRGAH